MKGSMFEPSLRILLYILASIKKLSVIMLCMPVFIFTSGSSTLFRAPTLWFIDLSLLAIFNTLFWVYAAFCFRRNSKQTKHKNTQHLPFSYHMKMATKGAESIRTERASLTCSFLWFGSSVWLEKLNLQAATIFNKVAVTSNWNGMMANRQAQNL